MADTIHVAEGVETTGDIVIGDAYKVGNITKNHRDAIIGALAPAAGNVFATMLDVAGSGELMLPPVATLAELQDTPVVQRVDKQLRLVANADLVNAGLYRYSVYSTEAEDLPRIVKPSDVMPITLTGTVAITLDSPTVTGTDTLFTTEVVVGDHLKIATNVYKVLSITDNITLTLEINATETASGVTVVKTGSWYRIATPIADHNLLTKINDGVDYLHLNSTEKTEATREATAIQNGLMSSTYASKLDGIEVNAKDDQMALEVPNTPAGNITATDVQGAINELDTEKVAKAGDTMIGDLIIFAAQKLATDTIEETTLNSGVTIDTVLVKDGLVDGADISAHAHTGTDGTAVISHGNLSNKNVETDIKHVTDNQKDALDNANSPATANPVLTRNDLPLYQSSSDGETSTTSTVFIEKLKLATGILPAGNYRIGWSAEIKTSDKAQPAHFQIQVDDNTVLANGSYSPQTVTADGFNNQGGFSYISLTNVAHDIDIDFKTTGATAYIRRARIEIWRVS